MKKGWWEHIADEALWEQPYADLWSIAHLLSGALFAFAFLWLGFGFWTAFSLNLVIAIFWELFEEVTELSSVEYLTNSFTDILFSQLGFVVCYRAYASVAASARLDVFLVLAVIFAAFELAGWLSYPRRS